MWKCALLSCLITAIYCGPTSAQGRAGLLKGLQGNNESDNRRKDVEGVIWEYKVMEHDERDRSERTKMTGRLRIKQTSIFAVGKVEYANNVAKGEQGDDKAGAGNESAAGPRGALRERLLGEKSTTRGKEGADIPKQAKSLLSQRLSQKSEEQVGSERIGDLIKQNRNEYTFRFDEDDDYPLSGLAVLQPDTTGRGGVWLGRYDEFENGKKKKRWRIEMRKVEE
jgi:hypothetical protein